MMNPAMTTIAAQLLLGSALTLAAPAPVPPELTPAPETASAFAQDAETPKSEPARRSEWPDTDSCPNALTPPEPTTTSEMLAPGQVGPTPPPVVVEGNCGVATVRGFVMPEKIMAASFLVADIDTGEIIAQKDPHGRYRPASIIKALLALVASRELPLDRVIVASHGSAAQQGSSVGIGEGGEYTVEQLLQGLLMGSGNDAAHALAQELGGDEATLRKINELAADLGTTDTYAATYSGLDAPGMSSSAHDLGLIYRAAYRDPALARIMNTETVPFPGYGDVPGYELGNDNGLFMNDPDGIGGKTGYTDDANHTFVGAMDRGGERLMVILLDTTLEGGRAWEQAQRLLHAAYDADAREPIGALTPVAAPTTATLTPGQTPSTTPADPETERSQDAQMLSILLPAIVALVALMSVVASMARRRDRAGRHRR
ncbi:D-alanyl-D-alanine carboxypeptidase DacD precursor [Corynebacterium guangdongense]|nr:D-alanyl-D-alanine carboxypeptidase DacD precursor [Corynebacterium guangdongense]